VHKAAVTDVDAVVPQPVEEHDVPGLEVLAPDVDAMAMLLGDVVRQLDADRGVDVTDEARAIETARRRAAPRVGRADVLERDVHDPARRRHVARARRGDPGPVRRAGDLPAPGVIAVVDAVRVHDVDALADVEAPLRHPHDAR